MNNIKLWPVTKAEKTIFWFLHGYRFSLQPKHFNCRCTLTPIEFERMYVGKFENKHYE